MGISSLVIILRIVGSIFSMFFLGKRIEDVDAPSQSPSLVRPRSFACSLQRWWTSNMLPNSCYILWL